MRWSIWWAGLAACDGPPTEPALTLEGPAEVRVDHLGPVASPRVLRADGTEPVAVTWSVADGAIATVQEGGVVALAPGSTDVTGTAGGDHVVYRLTVVPAVVLRFTDPPGTAEIGVKLDLPLEGAAPDVAWTTSDPAIAVVANGQLTGVTPGIVYVTARRGTSEALLQVEVKPAATPP